VIVVDTSAWVEFLRGTGSGVDQQVTKLLSEEEVVVPDLVRLELLAGAGAEPRAAELTRFLARFQPVATHSPADHDLAALLYRRARQSGRTVRSLLDCLIAAIALRLDAPLLARDRDFEALATISALRLLGEP
jgi:predicted nucleic acid-binding protein